MDSTITTEKSIIRVTPVVETMPADLLTPLGVFLALSAESKNCFLLESVEGGETLARYSFIGSDPEMTVSGNDQQIVVSNNGGERRLDQPLFDFLREHFHRVVADTSAELPSFIGGAIGYFDFSCVEWFEPSLKRERPINETQAAYMFYRSIVAFDHAKQVVKIVSLFFDDDTGKQSEEIVNAQSRNREIKEKLENASFRYPRSSASATLSEVSSNFERNDFENAVAAGKEYIFAGDCYQVVLSQRFSRPTTASDVSVYRALRSTNPSPYMFLLRFDDKSIIGASPEMLVRCTGKHLEYRPIAGTRPRGKTSQEDVRLAEEMRNDKKEVAEHVMLVDLGRNDLGRVAEFGTVSVDELMKVEKYSHVQHLVSALSAELRPGCDRFDALAACFPAGTVSGAPKVRSVEIIRELEPEDRGVYAGGVGYFDYAGNMDTCIAIRTLVLENGVAKIQAGAGIVADSIPELEYEETVNKAKALLRAIEIAEGGEL
ncbi:MAG TPA: anthranilate synthase component I [Pyrinomonadaceae bacterium]|nr:anthranilate synthase component I [Pyrinomonadaceae bacterium]